MLFGELSGILEGSVTVYLNDVGYCVSNDDASVLIDFYADREVVSIHGCADGVETFDSFDEQCPRGLVSVFLR